MLNVVCMQLLPTGYDGSLENESYPTSDEEEEPDEDESGEYVCLYVYCEQGEGEGERERDFHSCVIFPLFYPQQTLVILLLT